MNKNDPRGVDLHAHTNCSDGELSPALLVVEATRVGLAALAITDHDTTSGIAPARQAALDCDLEVIPGIEITSAFGGRELHLLGLFVDVDSAALASICRMQGESRAERAEIIVKRINRIVGPFDLEAVEQRAAGAPIGRPHVARAMVDRGLVDTTDTAFRLYLGIGRPCHVSRRLPPTPVAITAVHEAGGVAVVAHPASSRIRDKLLAELAELGLDGIEVRHPRHPQHRERLLASSCRRLGLLPSGGSDFHGHQAGAARLGQHRVPVEWLTALRQRACARRGQVAFKESRA